MISTERISKERHLLLNSCGIDRIYKTRMGSLRPDGRVDYHILYIAEGTCHVKRDGALHSVKQGNVIIFLPKDRQEYFFEAGERSVSYYIHFTGRDCESILYELGIGESGSFYTGKSRDFENVFDKMLLEYTLKKEYYEDCCASLLLQLLVIISRKKRLMSQEIDTQRMRQIDRVLEMMYRNMDKELSVEDMARECCQSVGYFSHLFKEIMGVAPHNYLTGLRMEKAKELLLHTDTSVAEIGAAVGFSDQNYFSRCFKRYTGTAPSEYRKMDRNIRT